MKVIPIQDVFNQTFAITLGNQNCTINLYQKFTGLYCDLYIDDVLIIGGVICLNRTKIVRDSYLGFVGDLMFTDAEDLASPSSPGLGTRFTFLYLEAADL